MGSSNVKENPDRRDDRVKKNVADERKRETDREHEEREGQRAVIVPVRAPPVAADQDDVPS